MSTPDPLPDDIRDAIHRAGLAVACHARQLGADLPWPMGTERAEPFREVITDELAKPIGAIVHSHHVLRSNLALAGDLCREGRAAEAQRLIETTLALVDPL